MLGSAAETTCAALAEEACWAAAASEQAVTAMNIAVHHPIRLNMNPPALELFWVRIVSRRGLKIAGTYRISKEYQKFASAVRRNLRPITAPPSESHKRNPANE